ncbi:MAG: hypothetical protein JKY98_06350 [Gammaproteobacteria bacterium]|nr:hypothetical protein [Gammaproteobacteria bacterium]
MSFQFSTGDIDPRKHVLENGVRVSGERIDTAVTISVRNMGPPVAS